MTLSISNRAQRQSGERLQPALLDRLTDEAPTRQKENDMPGCGVSALRAAVLRDLTWLFNTTSLAADVDLSVFPAVACSVLNYGVLPLAGKCLSELDSQELASTLRLAILQFEPRLLPDTVEVTCISSLDTLSTHNEMAFEIRGLLWSIPYPVEFLARSNLDLETGYTVLTNLFGSD